MKKNIKNLFSISLLAVAMAITLISQSLGMSTPGLISLSNPSEGFGDQDAFVHTFHDHPAVKTVFVCFSCDKFLKTRIWEKSWIN